MHRTNTLPSRRAFVAATSCLALAACGDTGPAAPTAPRAAVAPIPLQQDRLATIELAGRAPALYVQDLDGGNRAQVHFDRVSGRVAGNYSMQQLPVNDRVIMALGPGRWSPDGRAMRTVSPNSRVIVGDVEWSPDGRYIAYILNTGSFFLHPDLFVTDLVQDKVYRITTSGHFGPWDVFRFDAGSRGIWFTQYERWNGHEDGRVFRVDHATFDGTVDMTPERRLVGNPTALSRDGRTALVTRDLDSYTRDLVRVGPGDHEETVLDSGDIQWARFLEGDAEFLVARNTPWDDPYTSPPLLFELTGLTGGKDAPRTTLPTNPAANVVTYLRAMR